VGCLHVRENEGNEGLSCSLPLLRDKEELVRSNAVMAIGMIIAALEEGEEEELRQIAYRAIKQLEKNDQSEKVRQYIELAVEAFRG
jgi:hypothetical protein